MAEAYQRLAEHSWAPQQFAQATALEKVIPHLEQALLGVQKRYGELEKTLGAAAHARQHGARALDALRGKKVK